MVVPSRSSMSQFILPNSCKATSTPIEIPEIDLSNPQAKTLMVKASQDLGFFKLTNHGISFDLISNLEAQAFNFFSFPQHHKDKAGPPNPFGYGNRRIGGPNGAYGWIEYLVFNLNPEVSSPQTISIFQQNPETFRCAVEEYVKSMKNLSCEILELMAEGLGIEQRNVFSKFLMDERSDCLFRLNHYPPCEEVDGKKFEEKLIGFVEHTDPQIISVLRSNSTSGLQICLKDGSWVSIPPDNTSFFVNIGDCLQVMTNGRFKSVKHRVVPDTSQSRLSMIYFGAPALSETIRPLPCLMTNEEESLYKELTWLEYKNFTYNVQYAHDRFALFRKSSPSS